MSQATPYSPESASRPTKFFSRPEPDTGLRRGVSPPILLDQIRLTAPFIFQAEQVRAPYLALLRKTADDLRNAKLSELSQSEYFRLCLAAHYATVATFVPTDVDNQIRFRLWSPHLPTETLEEMADVVMAARAWDTVETSTRYVRSAVSPDALSGHNGEWFSVAVGAYGALRLRNPARAAECLDVILAEVTREAEIFHSFVQAGDGISLLKCSTLIAHNLGDLDRVMDMWNLPEDDPLRRCAYKAGEERPDRWQGKLTTAGRVNKMFMADENHRHFALRGPKCLRRSSELLLPIGPFFDDWGATIAKHPLLSPENVAEVSEALIDGWRWLNEKKGGGPNSPVGYARALSGIVDNFPGGLNTLCDYLPARSAKQLKTGNLRNQCATAKERFLEHWRHRALNAVRQAAKS